MTEKDLNKYYEEYINAQMAADKVISVSGFKKFLMIDKKIKITQLYKLDAWSGVRGDLDVLYEDFLTEKAASGGRNSQTYTQLLTKFYDKQARRGADKPAIKIEIDFKNEGENKI